MVWTSLSFQTGFSSQLGCDSHPSVTTPYFLVYSWDHWHKTKIHLLSISSPRSCCLLCKWISFPLQTGASQSCSSQSIHEGCTWAHIWSVPNHDGKSFEQFQMKVQCPRISCVSLEYVHCPKQWHTWKYSHLCVWACGNLGRDHPPWSDHSGNPCTSDKLRPVSNTLLGNIAAVCWKFLKCDCLSTCWTKHRLWAILQDIFMDKLAGWTAFGITSLLAMMLWQCAQKSGNHADLQLAVLPLLHKSKSAQRSSADYLNMLILRMVGYNLVNIEEPS